MSAQANLAGLYPPIGQQIWESHLNWQPIPVHTVPLNDDHILNPIGYCPRHAQLFSAYLESPDIKWVMERHASFINFLRTNSGVVNITLKDITVIGDALVSEKSNRFM